ncbi:hypothetical protein C8F01DRAFT_1182846 [Mycena amicta]|nr:hypothetical protein C8F01DRAFT_1182846 [Mycena amicta]
MLARTGNSTKKPRTASPVWTVDSVDSPSTPAKKVADTADAAVAPSSVTGSPLTPLAHDDSETLTGSEEEVSSAAPPKPSSPVLSEEERASRALRKRLNIASPLAFDVASLATLDGMGLFTDAKRTEQQQALNFEQYLSQPEYDYIDATMTSSSIRGKLENTATMDPSAGYRIVKDYLRSEGSDVPLRMYLFGVTTWESSFLQTERRRGINVMPIYKTWGRTTGVLRSVFGMNEANVYSFKGGLSFSTAGGASQSALPTNNSFAPAASSGGHTPSTSAPAEFNWPQKGSLSTGDEIRVFDGRDCLPFDMKDYRRLPRFVGQEVPSDSVVAIVFTVNRFVAGAQRVINLSFNVNEVVVLSDPVRTRPQAGSFPEVTPFPWNHYSAPTREKKHA